MKKNNPKWKVTVDLLEKVDIVLLHKITRRMIYYLYTRHSSEILELVKGLEPSFNDLDISNDLYRNVPNPKKDTTSLRKFVEKVFEIAGETLPDDEISKQLNLWLAQEKSRFLCIFFKKSNTPLSEIKDALNRFFKIEPGERHISQPEFVNLRVSLIKRFLSEDMSYINVAKKHITVNNFSGLLNTVIGPGQGSGRLGGKSAGLILGHEIIKVEKEKYPELKNIEVPISWYITSDAAMDFIHYNALEDITSIKYMDSEEIGAGYTYLQQLFKHSFFTAEIINQIEVMLDNFDNKPIIVRSSSLLEDSYGASFSGKYKSLFLTNTGSKKERLSNLLDAIAEIYASVYSPDPIEYRKERGLIDFNEEMGILVQEVVGKKVGKYFFPLFAGVAFSNNEFRWSPRIKKEDGMVRMVFGLGTRAVDRIGDDYSFLASPGKPGLRVNIDINDIVKYSQNKVDVLNLETNKFETVLIKDILKEYVDEITGIEKIISIYKDGTLSPPLSILYNFKPSDLVVTFQSLIDNTNFLKEMNILLNILKNTLGYPVDVEFAYDGEKLYFLQCRPQGTSVSGTKAKIPDNINENDIIFTADKYITSGAMKNIEYIVHVVPEAYNALPSVSEKKKVALVVSKLNRNLPKKKFALIGPGRWGSRGDIKLGVPVTYSNINNTALLIEVAYKKEDYVPELSFGTHFFQDLVESKILYLPLYPGENGNVLRREIFEKTKNRLKDFAPEFSNMNKVVKVTYIPDIREKSTLSVIMDEEKGKAVAFLTPQLEENGKKKS